MKKFSILAAFVFAVMISSTALAANWVVVDSSDENDVKQTVYVDKDSIKRGVESERYNFSRADGFSAIVKTASESNDGKFQFTLVMSAGFFEDNGAKKYCILEVYDENGKSLLEQDDTFTISNADGSDGNIWPKVWDYVEKNLP